MMQEKINTGAHQKIQFLGDGGWLGGGVSRKTHRRYIGEI